MFYKLLLGTAACSLTTILHAGTFIPNETESYSTEDIQKIVFDGDKVVTYWEDGKTKEYDFSSLQRIYFSDPGSVTEIENEMAEEKLELYLFPNPVSETLTLKGIAANTSVFILSADGKVVSRLFSDGETLQANVSNLPQGIYYLKADGKAVKFVKR